MENLDGKIRLLAMDLDDTLFDSKKRISKKNQEAIAAVAAQGITVVPVTGRPRSGVPEEVTSLPGVRYIITSNGAAAYDQESGKDIDAAYLSKEDASFVFSFEETRQSHSEVFINGFGYTTQANIDRMLKRYEGHPLSKYIAKSRRAVKDVEKYTKDCQDGIDGMYISCKDVATRDRLYEKLKARDSIHVVLSSGGNGTGLEVEGYGADKGMAIKRLGQKLGIPVSAMIAFGDSDNDCGMLKTAGYSVAMGGGTRAAKEAASYVTASCEESGLAKALYQLGIIRK